MDVIGFLFLGGVPVGLCVWGSEDESMWRGLLVPSGCSLQKYTLKLSRQVHIHTITTTHLKKKEGSGGQRERRIRRKFIFFCWTDGRHGGWRFIDKAMGLPSFLFIVFVKEKDNERWTGGNWDGQHFR